MKRKNILPEDLNIDVVKLWSKKWMLLTAGSYKDKNYNTMTVGWGSIGVMWNKPFVQVVVRPTRYTYEFIDKYNTFTLTAFPEKFREKLGYLGTVSGRDEDKITKSGLTVIPSNEIDAPGFDESELIIECKKIYSDDLLPDKFLDKVIEKSYPEKDYHRIYFGEILNISCISDYAK